MLKLLFLTPRLEHVLRKKQRATSTTTKKKKKKKKCGKAKIWFWVNCLTEGITKFARDQFTKLCRLTSRTIKEGAKINFKIPFLIKDKF